MFWEQQLRDRLTAAGNAGCPGGSAGDHEDVTPAALPAAGGRGGGGGGGRGRGAAAADRQRPRRRRQRLRDRQRRHGPRDEPADRHRPDSAGQVPAGRTRTSSARFSSTTCSMRRRRAIAAAPRTACGPSISVERREARRSSFDAKGAAIAGAAAPTFGTDGTIYIATGSGRFPGRERRRLARREDADAEGLVLRGRIAVHLGPDRVPAQGQGSHRGGQQGRPAVRARQRVAWRRRSQDAAPQELAVLEPGRRSDRPRHVARCGGHALGRRHRRAGPCMPTRSSR